MNNNSVINIPKLFLTFMKHKDSNSITLDAELNFDKHYLSSSHIVIELTKNRYKENLYKKCLYKSREKFT